MMLGSRLRGLALLTAIALPVAVAAPASAAARVSHADRARLAVRFLVEQQADDGSITALSDPINWTADAVVAMVAARRAPGAIERALDFLEANAGEVDTVGSRAKVAMALVAAGRDARAFAGRDLIAEIERSQEADGSYDSATVFSHALGMLAVAGAGGSPTLEAAAAWLVAAQCGNGGWQFESPPGLGEDEHCSFGYPDLDEANTDATALAVMALDAVSVTPERDPFPFFDSLRDERFGGWRYDRPTSFHSEFTSKLTNANSTGLVLQAYAAAGRPPPSGSLASLGRLQGRRCGPDAGAISYTWADDDGDGSYSRSDGDRIAATIAAVPGLLGAPWPQPPLEVTRPAPRAGPCPRTG